MIKRYGLILIMILGLCGCNNKEIPALKSVDYDEYIKLEKDFEDLLVEYQNQKLYLEDLEIKLNVLEESVDDIEKIEEIESRIINLEDLEISNFDNDFMYNIYTLRNYEYLLTLSNIELKIGYVSSYDIENNDIQIDEVEWITDFDRLEELGLTEETLPSGYYIYNPNEEVATYKLSDDARFYIVEGSSLKYSSGYEFKESQQEYSKLCQLFILNNEVLDISELYQP